MYSKRKYVHFKENKKQVKISENKLSYPLHAFEVRLVTVLKPEVCT